jgi:acyl-CoA dehydrogenase
MLMTALAAGRGISLPSQSAASAAACARATGAYARVRKQFNVPIGKFEGVQVPLAEICANAYLIDAARRLTVAALDEGHKPSVISAIMKYHATERMRRSVEHAMDIHGGKGIIEGPKKLSGGGAPLGADRHHGGRRQHPDPQSDDFRPGRDPLASAYAGRAAGPVRRGQGGGLEEFDRSFWRHVGHSLRNTGRASARLDGGLLAPAPVDAAMARTGGSCRATRRPSRCWPTCRC